jgi:hypothetical protein
LRQVDRVAKVWTQLSPEGREIRITANKGFIIEVIFIAIQHHNGAVGGLYYFGVIREIQCRGAREGCGVSCVLEFSLYQVEVTEVDTQTYREEQKQRRQYRVCEHVAAFVFAFRIF